MKGVQFLMDEIGNPKAVVLDLDEWGEIWEDIYFGIVSATDLEEGPAVPWEEVKADMDAELEEEAITAGMLTDD